MGFEDEMNDLRDERNAPPPLSENDKKAIERAKEFAKWNKDRPVFFDGSELKGEYTINGRNEGPNIVIDVRDDDVHTNPTGTITAPINDIYFEKSAAKAALGKAIMGDPAKIAENQSRHFATENQGQEIHIEGDERTYVITGAWRPGEIEIKAEYMDESGYPASLTRNVSLEDIELPDYDPSNAPDDDPDDDPDNIIRLSF